MLKTKISPSMIIGPIQEASDETGPTMACARLSHLSRMLTLLVLVVCLSQSTARAQNCAGLAPSNDQTGRTDWTNINTCLNGSTHSATLLSGKFFIDRPILFPRFVSGVFLRGSGNTDSGTVIRPVYSCGAPCPDASGNCFVKNNQFKPVIYALDNPSAKITNLKLDLVNLRRSCGYLGSFAVTVQTSRNALSGQKSNMCEVSSLVITGSPFGSSNFTTGGANMGGINIIGSRSCRVLNNTVIDVDFMFENGGGTSAGHAGIQLDNSGSGTVQGNTVRRVAFGIQVNNQSLNAGYNGDSSGTSVIGNTIVGAANINCPQCSQGRALKLQACGDSTIVPERNLVVRMNTATEFGGANGMHAGSGLDLICGVQYSTFENNSFIGAATADYGLQIRSTGPGDTFDARLTTHHNTINGNTFRSGRGQTGCTGDCYDVNFTPDGPDQIGIRRRFAGTNSFSSVRDGGTDHGCGDYAHAFYNYPAGQTFINRGQALTLAAAGVKQGAPVTFKFMRTSDNALVATYNSPSANGSCVLNQQLFTINSAQFAPGVYSIFASYGDGNSNASIVDDPVGTITVR